ncbi:uncharacterized protein LOC122506120 [Leptopilina heterotoma]|uniref:uncharacterized protein LOC122506120 n=1 Tax=Leptopilina heterotoma TaxID=63436 RepID=UPI001CA9E440|nr:uncharacterized protein LOC122506120 [Leptopilina heterotoma]
MKLSGCLIFILLSTLIVNILSKEHCCSDKVLFYSKNHGVYCDVEDSTKKCESSEKMIFSITHDYCKCIPTSNNDEIYKPSSHHLHCLLKKKSKHSSHSSSSASSSSSSESDSSFYNQDDYTELTSSQNKFYGQSDLNKYYLYYSRMFKK